MNNCHYNMTKSITLTILSMVLVDNQKNKINIIIDEAHTIGKTMPNTPGPLQILEDIYRYDRQRVRRNNIFIYLYPEKFFVFFLDFSVI